MRRSRGVVVGEAPANPPYSPEGRGTPRVDVGVQGHMGCRVGEVPLYKQKSSVHF